MDTLHKMKDNDSSEAFEKGNDAVHVVKLQREINLLHAVAVMTGIMIGSGIFVSPISIITQCGSVGLSLIIWALSGGITLCIALCFIELAHLYPKSGGEYSFFLEIMGPLPAFLDVWMQYLTMKPCFIAILALTTVNYIYYPIYPDCALDPKAKTLLAASVVFAIAAINIVYLRYVVRFQTFFMVMKFLALVLIIVGGIIHTARGRNDFSTYSFENTNSHIGQLGNALFSGIFTYSGWHYLFNLLEEVKSPGRTVARSVYISFGSVTVLYLLTNIAYFAVMTPDVMMNAEAVAVTFAISVFGPVGAIITPLLVASSTIGALNGTLLGGTRKYFAAARDGLFPAVLSLLHVKYNTPWPSILTNSFVSVAFILTGDAVHLIEYNGFVSAIVHLFVCICVIYLRYRCPYLHRPYSVPLPMAVLPVVVLSAASLFTLYENPYRNGIGILLLLTGIPAYLIGVVWKKPSPFKSRINMCYETIQKICLVAKED